MSNTTQTYLTQEWLELRAKHLGRPRFAYVPPIIDFDEQYKQHGTKIALDDFGILDANDGYLQCTYNKVAPGHDYLNVFQNDKLVKSHVLHGSWHKVLPLILLFNRWVDYVKTRN